MFSFAYYRYNLSRHVVGRVEQVTLGRLNNSEWGGFVKKILSVRFQTGWMFFLLFSKFLKETAVRPVD